MLKPTRSTRPSPQAPQSAPERTLRHPADNRGELLDRLGTATRGANTVDPEIEDPSVSFPASTPVDQYRSDGRARLAKSEAGTAIRR